MMSMLETSGAPGAGETEAFIAPASFGQERFWMMDRMDPGRAAWSLPLTLRLRGALRVDALRAALAELARRHESLRTVLQWMDGGLSQVIFPEATLPLHVHDLDGGPEGEREAEARRRLAVEVARPFDLERGPLARARLYRLADDHHVLLINLHHAVTDGWSTGILVRELSALYSAFARGLSSPLPEPELQYADFAEWQREQLTGASLERQLGYWRRALAGAPALLELPSDRPRPPVHDGRGAVEPLRIGPETTSAVHALARMHGATPFMVLLAAFEALLSRWARQSDVVVGTPVAGRTRPETRDVVGFFVNTLPLRGDLSGDPPFSEFLRRMREAVLGAFGSQDLPFERLVDELNVPRSAAHAPVFQVMFVLQNTPEAELELEGLRVEALGMDGGTSPFDLRMGLHERGGEITGGLQYATALFERGTAQRMIEQYRTLLAGVCEDPSRRISRLPLLSASEEDAIIVAGQGRATRVDDRPVHAMVEAQTERTPSATAVVSRGESLTYEELDHRARQLAGRLAQSGVGRGSIVAISMQRSVLLPVAMLGVWKTGAAYVPVDPAYPLDRRAFMLADSGAAVVLVDAGSVAGLPPSSAKVVVVDPLDLTPCEAPSVRVDGDDLAYVIYTSGSTGRPKGVMVPHRGVAGFLSSMGRVPGMSGSDVMLAVTSLSFDIAVLELLLPLTVGAKVVIAAREDAMDAGRLSRLLERAGATMMQATPATWRMLAQSGWAGSPRLALLSGGEALSPELARQLLPRGGALWNLYGPTETTIWSTIHRVDGADSVPLGTPIDNTHVHVLDDALRPCPMGVPGELCIGGIGVVRGYLRRPSQTAERFIPDPFATHPGARLYRTGDLVRRKVDGTLEFLGRTDFQVKVRGFRIELGEIEARLAQHPAVRQAVAVVRNDGGEGRLVAYVVPESLAPTVDTLRGTLAERLPEHMIPGAFVILDALPLTPNGKIDRRALPAPESRSTATFVAPGTAAESTIVTLWREVLRTERVGVEDNFFDLGGSSLSLIRLAQRLGEEMGSTATAVDLFRFPTVRTQAAFLAGGNGKVADPVAPTESADRAREAQNRMAMLRGMRK